MVLSALSGSIGLSNSTISVLIFSVSDLCNCVTAGVAADCQEMGHLHSIRMHAVRFGFRNNMKSSPSRPGKLPTILARPPSSVLSFTLFPREKRRYRLPSKRRSNLLSASMSVYPFSTPSSPPEERSPVDLPSTPFLSAPRGLSPMIKRRRVQSRVSRLREALKLAEDNNSNSDLSPWSGSTDDHFSPLDAYVACELLISN